jgi:hypothetical protein
MPANVANKIDASKSHGEAVSFAWTNVGDPVRARAASTTKPRNDAIANAHSRRLPRSHNLTSSADAFVGSKFNFQRLQAQTVVYLVLTPRRMVGLKLENNEIQQEPSAFFLSDQMNRDVPFLLPLIVQLLPAQSQQP